jgi:DNA polymerase-3 subunit beta
MKFSAPAEPLRAALIKAAAVIENRNVIPILGSIRFEAIGNVVSVTTSAYDLTITAMVEAFVEEPGVACIPALEIVKLVGLAKKASVQIETGERTATVSFGRTSAEMLVFPPEDFPSLPDYGIDMQDVDGDLLSRALKFAAVAASNEETRYHLVGVNVFGRDGGTIATGTDGRRLHRATMPTLSIDGSATIPSKHVGIIADIVAGGGRVRFALGPRFWAVVTDTVQARGSVIDGEFPDVDRLINEAEIAAIVDREAFSDAVEIASTGSEKSKENTVFVVVDIAGDEIGVRGFRPGAALAKGISTALAAETRTPVMATFNAAFLQDTLRSLDCDRVAVLDGGPLILHVEPAEQSVEVRLKALVMGIRANPAEMAA